MKKSVLVEKLGDRIAFHFCKEPGTGEYDYLAEQLLEIVEEAGMKPPIKKRCPVLLTDTHVWENEHA